MKTRLSITLVLMSFSAACPAQEPQPAPQQCWTQFRQAVLANDYARLSRVTQFPLSVHGAVDGIPVQQIGRDQFEATFTKILNQPLASFEGDKLVTYTQRDLVHKTAALPAADKRAKSFRVGELEFEYPKGECKLVRAYLSE